MSPSSRRVNPSPSPLLKSIVLLHFPPVSSWIRSLVFLRSGVRHGSNGFNCDNKLLSMIQILSEIIFTHNQVYISRFSPSILFINLSGVIQRDNRAERLSI